ncbi:MAG TPA: TetR/AcrR family transcriptional regulator [bacterium]|jgi:AcrR family transcriptional regulator|nr:TetR/AcrR family transcriptional regulator [bacterium]HPG44532.1 TetR/AcrR family transcriptional regulator [bacterium]HPM97090.1 TetR/AcrR family transcriptional regulator [bacterium]
MAEIANSSRETKAQIIRIAAHLFALKGYDGVSMREISEKTGVTKPTIYYYFGNKEGLYRALIDLGLKNGDVELEEIFASDLPLKEKLKKILFSRFQLAKLYPDVSRFFIRRLTAWEPLPFQEEIDDYQRHNRLRTETLIRQGIESGELGPQVNPVLATDIFAGILMHFIRRLANGEEKHPIEWLTHELVELYFRGLNE